MNWKALGPLLGVILLAALAFAFWPEVPPPPTPLPKPVADSAPTKVLRQTPTGPVTPPPPTPGTGGLMPLAPTPSNEPEDAGPPRLDDVPDPERLAQLGIPESAIEPEDAGVILKLERAAFKATVATAVSDCSRAHPVAKRSRLEFQLVEIPGRARSKIMNVERSDAGSDALADCVREKVRALRFEVPRGGETRMVFPLSPPNEKGDTL